MDPRWGKGDKKQVRRHGTMKPVGSAVAIVAAIAVPVAAVALQDHESAPPDTGLAIGDAAMWDGEYVRSSRSGTQVGVDYYSASPEQQRAGDPCTPGSGVFCRKFEFEVIQAGGTLRVAIDVSKRGECYELEVRDPDGRRPVAEAMTARGVGLVCAEQGGLQAYDIELAFPNAAEGTWQVRAIGFDVEDWAFRLRANLDAPRRAATGVLAPNLVPWLPWEFGFVAPLSPRAGQEIDRRNPPGPPGVSCHSQEAPVSKCLRFSSGVHNTGDGPLYLAFRDDQAFQHVYRADSTPETFSDNETNESYEERAAGPAEWHAAHGHRHFAGMMLYELFAVDPSQETRLRLLGTGHKHGFCTVPQQVADWSSFEQDPQDSAWPADVRGVCHDWMALPRGWGDVYRWQRTGQYLPYDGVAGEDGTMAAGWYVVRITVDPDDLLLETNEADNTAYALIRVVDGDKPNTDRVVTCERGFGDGPWDPDKRVAEPDAFQWAKRLKDPSYMPEACAPLPG